MKLKFSLLSFVFILISVSCGKSVDCDGTAFVNDINSEIQALNSAGQAWATDPTPANCDAYKKAANNYLDAVEDYKDCDELDQVQYQQVLDQAREAVNSISCN